MFKIFKDKKVSSILCFIFFVNLFYNYNLYSSGINLAGEFSNIVESFDGRTSGKVVIINDLHQNKEVQENICKTLEKLKQEHKENFKNVYVEGLEEGKLDLSILEVLPRKEREKYINIFMEKGLIQGSEKFKYFHNGIDIFGAEDKSLYLENFRAFYKSFHYLDDLDGMFRDLGNGFKRNRKYFLTRVMGDFIKEKESFRGEKLEDYIKYLKDLLEKISDKSKNLPESVDKSEKNSKISLKMERIDDFDAEKAKNSLEERKISEKINKNSENFKKFENIVENKKLEKLENLNNLNNLEKIEVDLENAKRLGKLENIEKIKNLKDSKNIINSKDLEKSDIKNIENIKNQEKIEKIRK